jgi:hypothetical protein
MKRSGARFSLKKSTFVGELGCRFANAPSNSTVAAAGTW